MKQILALMVLEACSITCAVFAGIMALHGISGWGWFLLAAILTTVCSTKSKE